MSGVTSHPLSATETALLEIWKDVLEIPVIGTNDEFLDLGGDSLAAMMCISRVRRTLDYELMVEDFFADHATIATFASAIDADKDRSDAVASV